MVIGCAFCGASVDDELAAGWIHLGIAVNTPSEPSASEIAAGIGPESLVWTVTADYTFCSAACFVDVAEKIITAARKVTLKVSKLEESALRPPRHVRRARGHSHD